MRFFPLILCLSCASVTPDTPCENLCDELTRQCAFDAFPSYTSCLEGCLYNEENNSADTEAYLTCAQEAECDEFEIMECEHQHGASEE